MIVRVVVAEYVIFFLLMWGLAYVDFVKKHRFVAPISYAILFLFISMRVDTGYDWPVYKALFSELPRAGVELSNLTNIAVTYKMEPLFVFFVWGVKLIIDDFQFLILVVSVVEVYALYRFLKSTSISQSYMVAVCSSWLLFTLYFSVLRQGMAVSMFLLFLSIFNRKLAWIKVAFFVLSIGFQVSSLLYYIIYSLSFVRINRWFVSFLFLISIISSVYSEVIFNRAFLLLYDLNIPVISEKAAWYMNGREGGANFLDEIFVYIYSVVMYLFLFYTWERYSGIYKVLSVFSIIFVCIQIVFVDYPFIRNRLQYVSFPMQFVLISNYFVDKGRLVRDGFYMASIIFFGMYFYMVLSRPYSMVYIPYQDVISHKVLGIPSTGEERQKEMWEIRRRLSPRD